MWWCCGKRGKDQAGCKFSKHESKEEGDDEFTEHQEELERRRALKNIKCACCKETGH